MVEFSCKNCLSCKGEWDVNKKNGNCTKFSNIRYDIGSLCKEYFFSKLEYYCIKCNEKSWIKANWTGKILKADDLICGDCHDTVNPPDAEDIEKFLEIDQVTYKTVDN